MLLVFHFRFFESRAREIVSLSALLSLMSSKPKEDRKDGLSSSIRSFIPGLTPYRIENLSQSELKQLRKVEQKRQKRRAKIPIVTIHGKFSGFLCPLNDQGWKDQSWLTQKVILFGWPVHRCLADCKLSTISTHIRLLASRPPNCLFLKNGRTVYKLLMEFTRSIRWKQWPWFLTCMYFNGFALV